MDHPDHKIQPEVRESVATLSGRRPTMTEVALEAGVSQTTVSLVLNDAKGARLSADTRHRVHDAAKKLGYRLTAGKPSAATSAGTIAFVVNEFSTDPWMCLAMDGAREKAWEYGITITAASTRGDPSLEHAVLESILAQPLVGLIYGTIHTRRIERLDLPRRVPTVLLNCYLSDRSTPSVLPAETLGGHTATDHLIRAGHTRIGMINGESRMDASRDRLKGYRRAHASADLQIDLDLIRNGNWEPSEGYHHTLELMALKRPPTAIFCANDMMAFGCYEALKELGLSIPGDVAVMGYDDREIAKYMHPPLTTVVLPHFEMGSIAAELLIDQMARRPQRTSQIKVEGNLVERGSV
jgi:LacI family transcriptional regulator